MMFEYLAHQRRLDNIRNGDDECSLEFTPGCPNRCWFCDVWKRDGDTPVLIDSKPVHATHVVFEAEVKEDSQF
jgi:radical SAM superfamily enzyme YgiQ (UPF0313 family)